METTTQTIPPQRESYTDLLARLADRAQDVVKDEYKLLRAELKESGGKLLSRCLIAILAGVLFVGTMIPFYIAAIIILGNAMDGQYGLASLIVGVVAAVGSFFLLQWAVRSIKEEDFSPKLTEESVAENVDLIKKKFKELKNATAGA